MNPKDLVEKLLGEVATPPPAAPNPRLGIDSVKVDGADDQQEADRIYDEALDKFPSWWEHDEDTDIDELADSILNKILSHYGVEPGSNLADLIFEHIYAGLT